MHKKKSSEFPNISAKFGIADYSLKQVRIEGTQPFHPSSCMEGFFHGKLLMQESQPAKAANSCHGQVVVNAAAQLQSSYQLRSLPFP